MAQVPPKSVTVRNWFVEEISPYFVAAAPAITIAIYCFLILSYATTPAEDEQWARATLSAIAVGVGGIIFDKATK